MHSVRFITRPFYTSIARFGIVAGFGNSVIVRNVVFLCSYILAGNSVSLFKGELVSLMRGFCPTSMIRLPIVIGVQLTVIIGYHEYS